MEISRRGLIKIGMVQAAALAFNGKAKASELHEEVKRHDSPSILQGATDETRSQFSIVHARNLQFRLEVDAGAVIDRLETKTFEDLEYAVTKLYVSQLSLGMAYTLKMIAPDLSVIDERRFRALDTKKTDLKFAICSCMDDNLHTPEIWQDLAAQRPDVIFFIGDSVYCDYGGEKAANGHVSPRGLWQRFTEGRRTLEVYYGQELTPILATWDDHDFGQNDSGANNYPYVKESQANFLQFFAQDPAYCSAMEVGPGVASRFVLSGMQVLLLDDRSWRISGTSRQRYAHWGQEQEEWMLEKIRAFDGPTWFMNGTQIFPRMIFKESVSGQSPVQFKAVVEALKQSGRKIIFTSGDVHFSEISEIEPAMLGYTTYELTSSSIHSYKLPGLPDLDRNPRRTYSTGEHNYLLVEASAVGAGCRFTVASHSADSQVNFIMNGSV